MPGQELHCSGILKTLFSFLKALHSCDQLISFFFSKFTDLRGDAGGCGFFGEGFRDDAGGLRGVRGFCHMSVCLFAWAVPCNMALFIAFKAAAFFPVLFFVSFGDGFLSGCTGIHCVWIVWGELLYRGLSGVLRPLVLLLPSPSLPEEGIAGRISHLCQWWSSGRGSIFGSLEALNQDIVPLLCLGCFCPLFEALGLF